MSVLLQIGGLFAICVAGDALAAVIPVPMPASVISMILLFTLLAIGWIKPKQVNGVGNFLLRNMAFFFVPVGVGIMEYFHLIRANWLAFVTICIVSTLVTFGVTGYTVKLIIRLQSRGKGAKEHA